ncbi:MAG: hypothetical protein ABSH25_05785 [Syntrophorhabdales bacterium]
MKLGKDKRFVLIGLLVLLCGCTTVRIAPETVSRLKRVGVISVTAHEFHRRYTGLTVFGNEREKQDISAWKIDDEYETQIQAALSRLGLFEAVVVPYDRAEFYPVYNINGPWDAPAFRKEWVNVEEQIRGFAQRHSLDAVVMVIWHDYEDFIAHTNQRLRGAGLYARGVGGMTSVSVIHLLSSLGVIDGQTGKPIVTVGLIFTKKVPPELARAELSSLDEAELRTMLIDLPKDGWEPKLRKIFMGDTN